MLHIEDVNPDGLRGEGYRRCLAGFLNEEAEALEGARPRWDKLECAHKDIQMYMAEDPTSSIPSLATSMQVT